MYDAWAAIVKPAHHLYVEPTKRHAHIVVPSHVVTAAPTHLHRRGSLPTDSVRSQRKKTVTDMDLGPTIMLMQAYFKQQANSSA